nr:nuclear transport factor 2 family protein [Saprospiraceae bacterium]
MRRYQFVWVFLCLTGFVGGITAANDSLEVLQLHEKKFEWMILGNLDSLSNLLAEDVMYVHSNGWVENKSEILENIESGHLTYRQVDIEEQAIRFYGSVAIVKGLAEFQVALDGNPITLDLLYSETYHLEDGKWRLVHRHACRPISGD